MLTTINQNTSYNCYFPDVYIFLIKRLLLFDETIAMTINQIAQAVFGSFADTDIVLGILNHNGSYVSNKLDIFERVFADQRLLDELCRRVDDGQEPVFSQINEYFIAASGLSCCGASRREGIGYAVMLLPAESFKSLDFIEVVLEQFSTIAGLIEENQRLRESGEIEKTIFCHKASPNGEMPVLASVN